MDFALTERHEMFEKLFREFSQRELIPIAAEIDETMEFPEDSYRKMAELGFMGIPFDEEFGGSGADELTYTLAIEELSNASAAHGITLSVHISLCANSIYVNGSKEQKEKYLRPLLKGEKLGAYGLTEPSAGTDASGVRTTAVLDEDEYILNGSKIFITNAGVAEIYVVFAMTDPSKGVRGMSAFIVEKGTEGFSFGKPENKMGIRASIQAELVFRNCRIPKENLLGKEGRGFGIAMKALDCGRIGVAAQAVGIAQAAYDASIDYSKKRIQFGKPISRNQAIQWMLADMHTKIEAARLLVRKAAWLKDNGKSFSKEAAMAKLYASETAMEVTTKAVQIHGGYGFMKDYNVERYMRDAKITEIYEGTSEAMRMVISGAILR